MTESIGLNDMADEVTPHLQVASDTYAADRYPLSMWLASLHGLREGEGDTPGAGTDGEID